MADPRVGLSLHRQCKVDGCGSVRLYGDLCGMHGKRKRRTGTTAANRKEKAPSKFMTHDDRLQWADAVAILDGLSPDQKKAFRELVADYRDATQALTGHPFVHVKTIEELVRFGWRKP